MSIRFRLCLALVPLLLAACGPQMAPYTVTLQRDDSLKGTAFPVDIVGVGEAEHQRWSDYSMTHYWTPDDTLHSSLPAKRLQFTADGAPQILSASDPIWKDWLSRKAIHLFILVNNPFPSDDQVGANDARRQIIPIDNKQYVDGLSHHEVKLTITKTGVNVDTPIKAAKQ